MFGPLPSEACPEVRPGCVDLGPEPEKNWYSSWFGGPKSSEPLPERPAPAHAQLPPSSGDASNSKTTEALEPDGFAHGAEPKKVRTVEVKPDGTLAKNDPSDAR